MGPKPVRGEVQTGFSPDDRNGLNFIILNIIIECIDNFGINQ